MRDYCHKHKKAFIYSLLFSLICFGFMLTNFTITIDEETWLLAETSPMQWTYQGRFSIWLFDLIFTNNGNYAPFLWDFLSILLWHLSGIIFSYILCHKKDTKEWTLFFFCAYYSSVPFAVGEILSFSMFNLQISTAMIAVAFALLYSTEYIQNRHKRTLYFAGLLLLYSTSIYQAMICVYVTGVVAYCLIQFLEDENYPLLYTVSVCAGICAAATVIYYGIDTVIGHLPGSEEYLSDNYNGWTSGNWILALAMAIANIGRVDFAIPYQGEYIYGGSVIRCITILFVIYAIWMFFKKKGALAKAKILFYTVALCAAPFTLYLALATYKTHGRMLIAIPLMGSVQLYLIFQSLNNRRLKQIMVILASYLLFLNARNMNLIFYYGNMVYEKDCAITTQLMYDIQKSGLNYRESPIAFVGMIPQDELPIQTSCTIGGSIYAWDDGNSSRMTNFIRAKGYAVQNADAARLTKAVSATSDMNPWPQDGSIKKLDDMIVIYLSSPTEKWYAANGVPIP